MVSITAFRELALSFPETIELPHFERTSFRVKQKIFATLHEAAGIANFKFTKTDQAEFCSFDKSAVYPVLNKWGLQGWTSMELDKVPEELAQAALQTAYREVLKSKPRK